MNHYYWHTDNFVVPFDKNYC